MAGAQAPFKNVAVVGAGGNIGPYVVNALLGHKTGGFNVTAIAREESKLQAPTGVKVVRGAYTPEFLEGALRGQDVVVLVLGTDAIAQQKPIISAAIKAGVRRILPSEFGNDTDNAAGRKVVSIYREKWEIVEFIKGELKAAGADTPSSWTGVETGPFFDFCLPYGVFGIDTNKHTATYYDGGDVLFDTTTMETVGASVAAILAAGPARYANQFVYLHSFAITQRQIVEALEKATGHKYTSSDASSDALIASGNEKVAAGNHYGLYDVLTGAMLGKESRGGCPSKERHMSTAELGLQGRDNLDEVVARVIASAPKSH